MTKYDPSYCDVAIKVLSEGKGLTSIAAELEVTRKTIYNWMEAHTEFAEAIEIGKVKGADYYYRHFLKGMSQDIEGNPHFALYMAKLIHKDEFGEHKTETTTNQINIMDAKAIIDRFKDES